MLNFTKLVFATGSRAIRLPVGGGDLRGVLTFRDMANVQSIAGAARRGTRVVVVGGGLLGIEAAYGLAKAGATVTLVHLMERLMERQLDARAAALLKRAVEAKGVEVLLEVATSRFVGNGRVEAVELKTAASSRRKWLSSPSASSRMPDCDAAGIAVNRGIVVDDRLISNAPTYSRSANAPSIAASATGW